ncbi:sorting nexin-4 [Leptonychotes weddellii]|uniref:Sorting nexin-4 n=1 Tax=Leptonychotes weddellii TaxID=9713 RepID=A0A7F8R7X2_LEPWE|nr:sorting nexin-4 [Leptonychotes weddellii]
MEQAPRDPERQLQPAPLEPLGHPDAGLQAAVGEEAEGARDEGSGEGTMTENNFWLKKIEISVSEAEKRTGRNAMNMQETYTAYLIETRFTRVTELVLRLHPVTFQGFLQVCVSTQNKIFLVYTEQADSRLKALNATFRVKNPDKRFTELKHYSDELQSVISHLLRVRARVADRLYGVYKVHGNYGRVFSEWSAIEKEMGDGLQSAGHHMDVYASSIDDILEDEEHYADQLKEYLFYAEALRAVCRKHELMQYDLEMAAQDLASKKQQCEELATGTVRTFSLKGMTTKLFGQETPEQREARIKVLEEQINEGEQQLKSKNLEGREFVKNAWADIERFKEQKNHDLKEALISYAVMQISMCKKGIQVWTNAKECFSKM